MTKRQSGFSLVELLVVCAIIAIASTFSVIGAQSILRSVRVDNAYNATITQLRLARQRAVDEARIYMVRFEAPRNIQLYQVSANGALTPVGSPVLLPSDIEYRLESGVPTGSSQTPDNFQAHSVAIDFAIDYSDGVRSDVHFYPDGTARDSSRRMNNGLIYLARPGELMSSRAVSLFGATGRIKGWRPDNSSGAFKWK